MPGTRRGHNHKKGEKWGTGTFAGLSRDELIERVTKAMVASVEEYWDRFQQTMTMRDLSSRWTSTLNRRFPLSVSEIVHDLFEQKRLACVMDRSTYFHVFPWKVFESLPPEDIELFIESERQARIIARGKQVPHNLRVHYIVGRGVQPVENNV